jgi:hypothetical protein
VKRDLGRNAVLGIIAVAAVAMLGAGVAAAISGQRTIERPATPSSLGPTACLSPNFIPEIDNKGSQAVSSKAGVYAGVYVHADGTVTTSINGGKDVQSSSMFIPRGLEVNVLFRNDSDTPRRLTARLGTFGKNAEMLLCTTAIGNGKTSHLTFKVTNVNEASSTPIVLMVPGAKNDIPLTVR